MSVFSFPRIVCICALIVVQPHNPLQDRKKRIRVTNWLQGLPDSDYETALIGDLEIFSFRTSIPEGKTDRIARDPLSFEGAMSSTDADKWRSAIMEE